MSFLLRFWGGEREFSYYFGYQLAISTLHPCFSVTIAVCGHGSIMMMLSNNIIGLFTVRSTHRVITNLDDLD